MKINDTRIGRDCPVYVVAEMSANHNQDLSRAVRLVQAAAEAGADAIKLQTYTPDSLTLDCDKPHFRIGEGTAWQGRTLYELYAEAQTPWDWHPRLKQVADDLGLGFFSTPFDAAAVERLAALGVPAFKVASFEIVDLPLIRRIAREGRPMILSTGMADLAEIHEAVCAARDAGCTELALLKCTSAYPGPPDEMDLRTLPHLQQAFDVEVGLSDHSPGSVVPVAAVALGACIVEKHLTLARSDGGPDSRFSMEPHEFTEMVRAVRLASSALGRVRYEVKPSEAASRVFRRSLFVVRDVEAGELLTRDCVRSIRPGSGLHPRYLEQVTGRRARRDIARGTPLDWDLIG